MRRWGDGAKRVCACVCVRACLWKHGARACGSVERVPPPIGPHTRPGLAHCPTYHPDPQTASTAPAAPQVQEGAFEVKSILNELNKAAAAEAAAANTDALDQVCMSWHVRTLPDA